MCLFSSLCVHARRQTNRIFCCDVRRRALPLRITYATRYHPTVTTRNDPTIPAPITPELSFACHFHPSPPSAGTPLYEVGRKAETHTSPESPPTPCKATTVFCLCCVYADRAILADNPEYLDEGDAAVTQLISSSERLSQPPAVAGILTSGRQRSTWPSTRSKDRTLSGFLR
jgi:hypothetical protein